MCDVLIAGEGAVEAGQGVLTLFTLFEGDISDVIASAKLADEDNRELALALGVAFSRTLILADDPVGRRLINGEVFIGEDVRTLSAGEIF